MPKIYENGRLREMTQEEIDRTAALPAPELTPEERLTALETENAHLKEALNLLLEGVTEDG